MADFPSPFPSPAAEPRRLALAFVFSILVHALSFATAQVALRQPSRPTDMPPPLQATLRPTPARPAPVLLAPAVPTAPAAKAASKAPPPTVPRRTGPEAASEVATIAARQIAANLLYPPEAIARGLEGEAQVMLFLDEAGNAVAARLEYSSGHDILDAAAVRAARAVRALPEGAPREVLLPVRFRLR